MIFHWKYNENVSKQSSIMVSRPAGWGTHTIGEEGGGLRPRASGTYIYIYIYIYNYIYIYLLLLLLLLLLIKKK